MEWMTVSGLSLACELGVESTSSRGESGFFVPSQFRERSENGQKDHKRMRGESAGGGGWSA